MTAEETFSFAGATVTVYPSALTLEDILDSGEKEYDNDLSLAVRLVDEDNTFWFLGDAKVLRIRELLDTEVLTGGCQVLKLPHHGRYSTETRPLLETVKPDNVVICCSGKIRRRRRHCGSWSDWTFRRGRLRMGMCMPSATGKPCGCGRAGKAR